jgi:nuclear pore complex protein Nup155
MNKQQIFNETKAYEERQLQSYKEIYSTCSQGYSNYRSIKKLKEYTLPQNKYDRCGIIPEMSLIWYAYNYRLSLFRYESNEYEEISTFTSKVLYADIFVPKSGIFNHKISFCFVVFTEEQVILYGVDNNFALFNTNFVASVPSKTLCYNIRNGSIFLGCENGNVYEVIYKSLDSWYFRMMYLYCPTASLISNLVPQVFKRKKSRIIAMSSHKRFLVALSKTVTVYNIEGGIFKVKDIPVYKEYVDIHIIEEKNNEVFFYCVLEDGTRDFYDTKHLFSKRCYIEESTNKSNDDSFNRIMTHDQYYIIIQKNKYQGSFIHFISYNKFQDCNLDRSKPCENQESFSLSDDILEIYIYKDILYLISSTKLIFYEICNLKRYISVSRVEEVYNMFKNLGERESLALYFDLVSLNCDISKLEYLCVKINENHLKGLFSFIYRQIKSFIDIPVYKVLEDDVYKNMIDKTVQKFRNLTLKLKSSEFSSGIAVMDYFNQTVFYVNLLNEYSINLQNKTFNNLVFSNEDLFKKSTLNELMDIYKTNQNIDTLINQLSNKSPDYLPLNEIYYHKGFDLLKKYPSKDKLWESLKNFKNVPYSKEIIEKYNDLKFYTGSVILLRKYFNINLDYEEKVNLLRSCIKCNGSIMNGLEDKREDFLYPFLDALCANLKEKEINEECLCCDIKTSMKLPEIIKLDVSSSINCDGKEISFLSRYLQEKSEEDSDPLIYELYWKYCAYRDDRINAVKSLLYLIDYKPITLEKRIDLLQKAKTVSLHTPYQEVIRNRNNLLKVQLELLERGEDSKNIKLTLLSADSLFNDYSYKYPDLSLRIIDQCTFTNKKVLEDLWKKVLDGDFKSAVNFLISNRFSGSALDCEIIGNILLNKMSKEDKLSKSLLLVGFTYKEVQKFIEHRIKKEEDPEFRSFLVEDFRSSSEDKGYCKKLEQYCVAN